MRGLAFEAESHRVGCHGLKSNCSWNSSHNHSGNELFDEYGEVEINVVMNGVEMHLPIIAMLISVKVATPEIQELEYRPKAYLLVQVKDVLSSRCLRESPSEIFQLRFVQ